MKGILRCIVGELEDGRWFAEFPGARSSPAYGATRGEALGALRLCIGGRAKSLDEAVIRLDVPVREDG